MNYLYLLTQEENSDYDTYDSCVVVAKDEKRARKITPGNCGFKYDLWASSPDGVQVTLLGIADDSLSSGEVVCSSFNAG